MKRKLAFMWDWEIPISWRFQDEDGIWAALRVLAKDWDVRIYTRGEDSVRKHNDLHWHFTQMPQIHISEFKPDFILCWGSLDRPWWELLRTHDKTTPMALCFAGGPQQHPYLNHFQHVFVESAVYESAFRAQGVAVSRAFGTNTEFFVPMNVPKIWEAIYPSAFCFHKNVELFCQAMHGGGLVVGGHNEASVVGKALSLGTAVLPHVSADVLRWLYNMSRVCVVPAGPDGGGQRVVLEAMSCGLPVVIMDNNDKCTDFLLNADPEIGRVVPPFEQEIRDAVGQLRESHVTRTRLHVLNNYAEHHYAAALRTGLEALCLTSSIS